MPTVVEVMARFGADTSSFRRNVEASTTTMRKMRTEAESVASTTNKSLDSMQVKSTALGTALGFLGGGVMTRVATGAMELGKAVLGQASNMQQAEMAFTTFLGSAEASEKFLKQLADFAAKTPFEFPELVDASKQMMAFGFEASQILPMMTAIGDAAAGLGTGAEGIERITRQLGQMKMKGVASGEELRAIAEAGVPAWQYLADTMGVTVPQAMKMVEKRLVSADDAIKAITEGLEKGTENARGFGGMMEQQSKTLQGVISTFKDSVMNSLVQAIKPLVEFMSQAVAAITPVAEALSKTLGGAIQGVTPLLLGAFKVLGLIAGALQAIPTPLVAAVAAFVALRLALVAGTKAWGGVVTAAAPVRNAIDGIRTAWMYAGQAAVASSGEQAGAMARLRAMSTIMTGGAKATGMLKSAGGALLGMLGGPWGIAIGGATLAVGAYMQAQQNAQQAVDSLTGALDAQSGAMTAEGIKQITEALAFDVNQDDWARLPVTMGQVAKAVADGGAAYDNMRAQLESARDAQNGLTEQSGAYIKAIDGVLSSMENQNEVVGDARVKWQEQKAAADAAAEATASMGEAAQTTSIYEQRMADVAAKVAANTKAVTDQFKILQGLLDRGAAKDNYTKSLQALGDEAEKAKGKLLGNSKAALALRESTRGSVSDLMTYAQSFKDPQKQAQVLSDGLADIRETLKKKGVKKADIDKFLKPFESGAATALEKGKEIGKNVVAGVEKGIAAQEAQALANAQQLGAKIVRAVRDGADVASPSKYTTWVGREIVNGLTKGVLQKAGGAAQVIKDATERALSAAGDVLEKWKQKGQDALDLIKSIKDAVVSAGSVANFQPTADATVWGMGTSAADVIAQQKAKVEAAEQFAQQVEALRKAGLNNQSLQEIINAGAEQGSQIAAALLAGGQSAIADVNSLEARLLAAGGALGQSGSQSQYGLTAAQAKGLTQTNVKIEKGAVVLTIGSGVSAADAAKIRKQVDDALDKLVDKVIRELRS